MQIEKSIINNIEKSMINKDVENPFDDIIDGLKREIKNIEEKDKIIEALKRDLALWRDNCRMKDEEIAKLKEDLHYALYGNEKPEPKDLDLVQLNS